MVGSQNFLNLKLAEALNFSVANQAHYSADIFIFRQLTLEPVEPFLKAAALSSGVELKVKFGGFDTWRRDLYDPSNEFGDFQCLFIFPDYWRILEKLKTDADSIEDFISIAKELLKDLSEFVTELRAITKTKAILLTPDMNDVTSSLWGLEKVEAKIWLNTFFLNLAQSADNFGLICLDGVNSSLGTTFSDKLERYFHLKLPFSESVLNSLAGEMIKSIRQAIGAQKKVIALDCDNTLWSGVCGDVEDIQELEVGPNNLKSSFHMSLQRTVKQLQRRGVLLVLLSKNEEHNVFEVFETHDGMVLQKDDIAGWRINWQRKSENIRSLAKELNVSLDSFLFIDDSPQEVNEMVTFCPEVFSLHLDPQNLRDFPEIIDKLGFFEKSVITDADRLRTSHFIAEKQREEFKKNKPDFNDYLNSLNIKVKVKVRDDVNLARIEQLAARTNQMNLNCWRATKAELDEINQDPNGFILSVELEDKFGDLGIIGAAVFTVTDGQATILLFVLSCRAFGRAVEHAMLKMIEDLSFDVGCSLLTAARIKRSKNSIILDVFKDRGYKMIENNSGEIFKIALDGTSPMPASRLKHLAIESPFK